MKDIILLHGALGGRSHWDHIIPGLSGQFNIHNLNFPLHGSEPWSGTELNIDVLAQYVEACIQSNKLTSYIIAGYSLGGYVALELARRHLAGLEMVITVATKLNWDQEIADKENEKLTTANLAPIHHKLMAEHGSNWEALIPATHSIISSIGTKPLRPGDFSGIDTPVTLLLGDRDKMVTLEETEAFAAGIKCGNYMLIPGQPHLLEKMDGPAVAGEIIRVANSGAQLH